MNRRSFFKSVLVGVAGLLGLTPTKKQVRVQPGRILDYDACRSARLNENGCVVLVGKGWLRFAKGTTQKEKMALLQGFITIPDGFVRKSSNYVVNKFGDRVIWTTTDEEFYHSVHGAA